MTEHDWVFKCGFCVNKCGFCLKESLIMLWFNRIYNALHNLHKRCERERGETLAEAREKGTEVGSPDAEVEVAADQESMAEEKLQRRRPRGRSACGGASLPRARRGSERRRRGALPGVRRPGAIPGENWLGRAGVPCRAGFQRCWCCGPWKVSAWALFPGKRPGTRRGNVLPNSP